MVLKKIIIIFVMILLIPSSLALIKESLPEKTNKEELCLTVATGSGEDNFIWFYIDNVQQKIKLEDLRIVDKIDATSGGTFVGCINLHSGLNEVEVRYTYDETEKFNITLDSEAPDLKGIDISDLTNNANPEFKINLDEDATLIITVNNEKQLDEKFTKGEHEIKINFEEGENTIKIEVRDELGNIKTVLDKTITVDTTKPKVIIESVEGKKYTSGMKATFKYVKIKGKTNPNVELKVFNVFDNTYIYDKNENKLLKSANEEFTEDEKSEQIVELDEQGNFEDYVELAEGKNTILFLATDKAGNQNIEEATDKPYIKDILILNYKAGENWEVTAEPISKIKGINLLKNEIPVKVEIKISPKKDITAEEIQEIRVSLKKDPAKEDNQYIKSVEKEKTAYYDRSTKNYVAHPTTSVDQWKKRLTDLPDKLHVIFDGTIIYNVGDPGKTKPIVEHIPIDLLFYVELNEFDPLICKIIPLIPCDIEGTSKTLEGSLNKIKETTKVVQNVALVDGAICAGIKFYNKLLTRFGLPEIPKSVEFGICDRVICKDTPPTVLEATKYPTDITYKKGRKYYDDLGNLVDPSSAGEGDWMDVPVDGGIPGPSVSAVASIEDSNKITGALTIKGIEVTPVDYYHEYACFPWNPFASEAKPVFSPVRVMDDLWESSKCLCLTGMFVHLGNLYSLLAATQGCLNRAMRGEVEPGECEVNVAQITCGLSFWGVEKFLIDKSINEYLYYRPYDVRRGGIAVVEDIEDINEAKEDIQRGRLIKKTFKDIIVEIKQKETKEIMRKACVNIITQDWVHIATKAVETAEEALPSYGKPVISSSIVEDKDDRRLIIEYNILPAIFAGTHSVRWEVDFICDPNGISPELCQGKDTTDINRHASDLKYSLPYTSKNVPAGMTLEEIISIKGEAQYWFNKLKLTLTYYVTTAEATVTETLYSNIKHVNEDQLKILCGKEDYKDVYELCKKVIVIPEQESESEPAEPILTQNNSLP